MQLNGLVPRLKRAILISQKEIMTAKKSSDDGLHGIRVKGALESTLARPQQLLHYEPNASIYGLAASYGYGFAKNKLRDKYLL